MLDEPAYFNLIFSAYAAYKEGYLPEEGGTNSQPAKFVPLMTIVDSTVSYCTDAEDTQRNVSSGGESLLGRE